MVGEGIHWWPIPVAFFLLLENADHQVWQPPCHPKNLLSCPYEVSYAKSFLN
jgi:hypothetical protein